jgi:pantoate kinase
VERTSRAFCPAGISSFFEICDRTASGKRIEDLERVGARGGGFVIRKGVRTRVKAEEAGHNTIQVFINGKFAPEAQTSRTVVEALLAGMQERHKVSVFHDVEIPISAGFGSSAGGALGTALALSDALGLKLTYNKLGRIAHVAEVKCKTGLGTVGPVMLGGCILTVEPGAPGIATIDRLPLAPDLAIVTGTFDPMPTKKVILSSPERRDEINRCGREALEAILERPSVDRFLAVCLEFAEKAGFMTRRVRSLVNLAEKANAIGVAQNMVGEAVHALTRSENAVNVAEAFRQVLPSEKIVTAEIDFQGARLLGA